MRNYLIFLKKELFESIKTFKLLILAAVFLLFGMISPLTAKFMPDILRWAMETDPTTAGMEMGSLLAEPVAYDSWLQFFASNIGQLGLIVIVIVFSSMLSSEISKGTLTIMLSKGLSRTAVVLSKLSNALIIWTGVYLLSFLTAWGYTAYLFPGDAVSNLFFASFCMWVFGVFLLTLTMCMAAVFTKGYACMLSVGGVVVVLSMANLLPQIARYNPISLISACLQLLLGVSDPGDIAPLLIVAFVCMLAFTLLAVLVFRKQKAGKKMLVVAGLALACLAATVVVNEAML